MVEEMKSLYKVYKSTEVVVGDKKELQFKKENIVKVPSPSMTKTIEEPVDIEKMLEEKRKSIIEKAEVESRQLLKRAEKEGSLIIAKAYEDSESVLENAKNEGYNKGLEIGQQKGYDEYQQLLEEAKAIKQEAYNIQKKLAKDLEGEIIQLVIHCIKKVIDIELDESHELLLNLIKKGLDKSTFTEALVIRVSEGEYEFLNSHKSRIYMMTEGIDEIEIKSDAALKKGSIIIETSSGKIDSSIDTQIKQIEALFLELLKGEGFNEENKFREI